MKKLILVVVCMIAVSSANYAQSAIKDPTYSSSNYKHQNKALVAKKLEANKIKEDKGRIAKGEVDRNYKSQNSNLQPASLVVVPSSDAPNRDISRNYKRQFKSSGESLRSDEKMEAETPDINTARNNIK